MFKRGNLFVPSKMAYVRGERPNVDCIFCAIRERHSEVDNLEVHRTDHFIVSANLYPYNPGHLLLLPKRHILTPVDLTEEEETELNKLQRLCLKTLEKIYHPQGYNVGYNIGRIAGGSIEHLHMHIVPRYMNEIGFIDILNNDRIMVEDPRITMEKLSIQFTLSANMDQSTENKKDPS